jgi:arginyl-tRNA synthetase
VKKLLYDSLRRSVAERIQRALLHPSFEFAGSLKGETGSELSPDVKSIYDSLVVPPDSKLGDLAFGCFSLAKALRSSPAKIALALAKVIAVDEVIERSEAAGPYLNIRIQLQCFGEELFEPLRHGKLQTQFQTDAARTMVEYSQPNTHKELHVGHMRNLCLGNSIVRLLRYTGTDVVSSTFPGDVGTHVAKCLWYMKFHNTEPIPTEGKGEWLGRMYSKGNLKLEDEVGTPKESVNREAITEILKQLEAKSGEYFNLWKETRTWSIELMQWLYDWSEVIFDQWYWESDVDSASAQLVKKWFAEGRLVQSDGAVGMDLSADGLGFALLLKSDGNGLYATKDLELARRKFEEFKIARSIYVVDVRQTLHFQQVFKVLEKMDFPQAKDCIHLQYNFVELPDGAMSSRKGNIVPISTLIHQMETKIKDEYLARYRTEWDSAEINSVATIVAQGAIKYGMLRIDTNKKIVFEMADWLRLDGDSGPFIQYSYARIASLLRKLNYDRSRIPNWTLAGHASERELIQAIMNFRTVAMSAAETYRPSVMCTYLFALAKSFNSFYHDCPIGSAETSNLREMRLALSDCAGITLKEGLALLGIPVPARM